MGVRTSGRPPDDRGSPVSGAERVPRTRVPPAALLSTGSVRHVVAYGPDREGRYWAWGLPPGMRCPPPPWSLRTRLKERGGIQEASRHPRGVPTPVVA